MVKVSPNCLDCNFLIKQESYSGCGTIIFFTCTDTGVRIYGDPKLVICNTFVKVK